MTVVAIEKRHRKHHSKYADGPMEDCWYCQRAKQRCKRKLRFTSIPEAQEWCREFNESHQYQETVTHYRCEWCDGRHMTATNGKRKRKRVEKQRRKWLTELRTESESR